MLRIKWLIILLSIVLMIVACNPPAGQEVKMPTNPGDTWDIVVIGDSSLWGAAEALSKQINSDLGVEVRVHDFTLGGLSAGSVRDILKTGKSERLALKDFTDALQEAEFVLMFVNPVDSQVSGSPIELDACFDAMKPGNCELDRFSVYVTDLEYIWGRIIELRAGQPTILRATDLYNPLVNYWQKSGVFEDCTMCWSNLSAAARQAAEAVGVPFLSRFDAYNGLTHEEDPREKGLISEDGEHPSDLAGEYTASLLSEMGYEATVPTR